jgi:hypothetical protein
VHKIGNPVYRMVSFCWILVCLLCLVLSLILENLIIILTILLLLYTYTIELKQQRN